MLSFVVLKRVTFSAVWAVRIPGRVSTGDNTHLDECKAVRNGSRKVRIREGDFSTRNIWLIFVQYRQRPSTVIITILQHVISGLTTHFQAISYNFKQTCVVIRVRFGGGGGEAVVLPMETRGRLEFSTGFPHHAGISRRILPLSSARWRRFSHDCFRRIRDLHATHSPRQIFKRADFCSLTPDSRLCPRVPEC